MDNISKILDSISKLIGTLIWPCLLIFILVRYKTSVVKFLDSLSDISFKGAGIEASFRRNKAEATAALVAATVARSAVGTSPEAAAHEVKAATKAVESITPRTLRRASRAKVLWVDDRPSNNFREQEALEALGIDFKISTSTEEALAQMRVQGFDAVISDMGRPPDSQAGYTLLDKMRASGNTTPVIFYAGSRVPEHVAESKRRGAMGCTNKPDELFAYVLRAIGREP